MILRFIHACDNLGCPAIQIGKRFYADLFRNMAGDKWAGIFVNCNGRQYWITKRGIRRN